MQSWQQQQNQQGFRPWDSSLLFGGIADLASAQAMLGINDADLTGTPGTKRTETPSGAPQQASALSQGPFAQLGSIPRWPQEQQQSQPAYSDALLEALRPSTMTGILGDQARSIFDSVSPPSRQTTSFGTSSIHGSAPTSAAGNVLPLASGRPATAMGANIGSVSALESSPKPKKSENSKDSKEKSGKRPRRRYDEIERLYRCNYPGCTKAYGTLNHLNSHKVMQKHGPKATSQQFRELRKIWRQNRKLTGSALLRPTTANGALDLGQLDSEHSGSPTSTATSPARNLPSSSGGFKVGDSALSHIRPAVTDSSSSSSPFAHNISLHSRGQSLENTAAPTPLSLGDLASHVLPMRSSGAPDVNLYNLANPSRPASSHALATPDSAMSSNISQNVNGNVAFNGLGSALGNLSGGLGSAFNNHGTGSNSLLPSLGSDLSFGNLGANASLGTANLGNFSRPSTSYDTLLSPLYPLQTDQSAQSADSHKPSPSSYPYNYLVGTSE